MLFRYCKSALLDVNIIVNDESKYLDNTNGMITFSEQIDPSKHDVLSKHFDVYVGMVTGKEDVFKNEDLGNVTMINGEFGESKYILLEDFPSDDDELNAYMLENKSQLYCEKFVNFLKVIGFPGEH